jgi:hypothetical protein
MNELVVMIILLHRRVAECVMKRTLTYNELVHHIDENPNNNDIKNLLIISRSNHVKLHRFLLSKYVALYELKNSNFENAWNILRFESTLDWIKDKTDVIKLWEIKNDKTSEFLI